MSKGDKYVKLVEWSDEDNCFIYELMMYHRVCEDVERQLGHLERRSTPAWGIAVETRAAISAAPVDRQSGTAFLLT